MATLPVPPGGDQNRAPALLAVFWVPFPFTVALVGARLFVRLRLKNLGLDDYSMFLAWILYTLSDSLATACMSRGGARHLYYLTPEEIASVVKYNFISQPFGAVSSALGKTSVAFLMLRIIGPNTVWRKWFIFARLAVYLPVTVASCIVIFVQCTPTKALWEKVPNSTCWNPNISADLTIFQSALGAFLDFALALIPITIIWKLQMIFKHKLALCILLSLGVFAGICASIKTSNLHSFTARADFTWATYAIFTWASLEIALVIICGSIPTVKPIYDHFHKGTPVRPAGANYRGKISYQLHSSTNASRKNKIMGRSAFSTNTTTTVDSANRSRNETNPGLNVQGIHVEQGVEIDHYNSAFSRTPDPGEGNVV